MIDEERILSFLSIEKAIDFRTEGVGPECTTSTSRKSSGVQSYVLCPVLCSSQMMVIPGLRSLGIRDQTSNLLDHQRAPPGIWETLVLI